MMDTDNAALRGRLMGALIGLARATDGNADLITDVTHMVMLEGLCTLADTGSDKARLIKVTGWAEDEKRRIVPNCFSCAAPCGRTADCDAARIFAVGEDGAALKRAIIDDIFTAAVPALETMRRGGSLNESGEVFYNALFALGEDWPVEYLQQVAQDTAKLAGRAF